MFLSLNYYPQLKIDKLIEDTNWRDLTQANIDELKDKFIHIAAVYGLPQDEVCTCEINLIE